MKRWLFALIVLLLAARLEALPNVGSGVCNARTTGSQASVSCTASVTQGNTVVLMGFNNDNATVGTYNAVGCSDDKGNTYRLVNIAGNQNAPGFPGVKMCMAVVTQTTSTTFTWTNQGGNGFSAIVVQEITGVVTSTSSIDQSKPNSTTGANSASATTLSTTTNDQIVIAALDVTTSGTITCPAGFTQIAEDETNTSTSYSACYKVVAAAGTQQGTWTSPAANDVNIIATFSMNAPGLTGANIRWTGHSCKTWVASAARLTTTGCALSVAVGNIVVMVAHALENRVGSADSSGCGDNLGMTWTYVSHAISAGGTGVKVCYAVPSVSAGLAVTWTNQGGTTWALIDVMEITQAKSPGLVDVTATSTGTTANAVSGTTGTTAQNNELVLAVFGGNAAGTHTCAGGYTQLEEDESNTAMSMSDCYKVVAATGTQSHTWTSPGTNSWATVIATFKEGLVSFGSGATFIPWFDLEPLPRPGVPR